MIGTGYVGLVTGSVFADLGNDVVCVDKDEAKIRMLRKGKMPIFEPGLEDVLQVEKNVVMLWSIHPEDQDLETIYDCLE